MKQLLDFAINTAKTAGDITLQYFGNNPKVELKPDQTPVTIADRACEESIIKSIQKDCPDDAILGEEFGEIAGKSEFKWIIDPIDGTKSFIRGIPMYATLLGLEKAGECVLGVVYAPAMNEVVYATKGGGCFCNAASRQAAGFIGERIYASKVDKLDDSLMLYGGFNIFVKRGMLELFMELANRTWIQRGYADYFGHILLAKGCSELMVEPAIAPWDLAAIKVIVEEAGGKLTDFDGNPTIYSDTAISSNGRIHGELLDVIKEKWQKS